MKDPKVFCRNMNHGKMNPAVRFCPNCGEKFASSASRVCNEAKHQERRKNRDQFCVDCGKSLKL